jgi:hypothetical protein
MGQVFLDQIVSKFVLNVNNNFYKRQIYFIYYNICIFSYIYIYKIKLCLFNH